MLNSIVDIALRYKVLVVVAFLLVVVFGVRAFRALPGIGDALRIGVAPWPALERLIPVIEAAWP